jgi:hypothetical protein
VVGVAFTDDGAVVTLHRRATLQRVPVLKATTG